MPERTLSPRQHAEVSHSSNMENTDVPTPDTRPTTARPQRTVRTRRTHRAFGGRLRHAYKHQRRVHEFIGTGYVLGRTPR